MHLLRPFTHCRQFTNAKSRWTRRKCGLPLNWKWKEKHDVGLRLEYHHHVAAGGRKSGPWTGEVQYGDVHGAFSVDNHRSGRGEGCHLRHGKRRRKPRRFESCCHFLRSRGLILPPSSWIIVSHFCVVISCSKWKRWKLYREIRISRYSVIRESWDSSIKFIQCFGRIY